jgi:hypothetical protein
MRKWQAARRKGIYAAWGIVLAFATRWCCGRLDHGGMMSLQCAGIVRKVPSLGRRMGYEVRLVVTNVALSREEVSRGFAVRLVHNMEFCKFAVLCIHA